MKIKYDFIFLIVILLFILLIIITNNKNKQQQEKFRNYKRCDDRPLSGIQNEVFEK